MFNFLNFHNGKLKQFPNEYSYVIERKGLLGEGHYSKVYSYSIKYYKKNVFMREIFLAGKNLKSNTEEYESKLSYLKKIKEIIYVTRKFNLKDTNIETKNFDLKSLNNIIFLSDFNLTKYNVSPINKFVNPNMELFNDIDNSQFKILFEKLFDSWVRLTREGLIITELDQWLVLYNKEELILKLVDVDFISSVINSYDMKRKYSKNEFFDFISYFPKFRQKIILQILYSERYEELIYELDFPTKKELLNNF